MVKAESPIITLAHGAGGRAMQQLIDEIFLSVFDDIPLQGLPKEDQAQLPLADFTTHGDRLAFTTDSFVVTPLIFPGGDIGKLAVCGTVNDLAVGGAKPLYLSAGFIIEEGVEFKLLESIASSMAKTAQQAGVRIVTGDTKVVQRGMADQLFINTSGVGVIPSEIQVKVSAAQPGDKILVNGFIGDHGAAVMLARENLGLYSDLRSDCALLSLLIQPLLAQCPQIRCIRDATRGGLGVVLNEIAKASQVTIELSEPELPIRPQTQAICEILGLEPLFLANEGMAAFIVPAQQAEQALQLMQSHSLGQQAKVVGQVTEASQGMVYLSTAYGGKRMLETPHGVQLPRIC
ncbi:hydrogenase expression/formation protein HypE [Spartinivicinus poritis]|uniref:Hydrogenase expression/formation protein HypE n=1 Tax=Spartinivicinus poritis TaxID=2994640 RepID=A0ABT5U3D1_9GAMM|nr:hydrogenase expression/formation protein HypE [Spartinivicinus sp. A2-2]MDE1460817.1 hydrogenase expression/formation protein HypE [Spartinivicinus sp. A2-2]